ncbi:gluconokinase [Pedobacter metabolipauper]|uniref:Gluconate kinase (FGGY family) n=1 Tax=Pedobacter metabolipauper TaxID=425513 RepID=A0A4R6T0B6_9SPHI|nr:gluconokinase [Pedobacter metabolipauper]TDQ11795.1 gluconate kinase (FGGY family) [Pedobacter metabolipauper]
MKYVLGVDIGTGSVKAVAVDLEGNSLETTQVMYGYESLKPGYHEQDADQIWTAFKACLEELLKKMTLQPIAIGLSSAMHSLVAVDEAGNALAPMMTWADARSSEIAVKLRSSAQGQAIYKVTGTPLHAMSPLCKLIWISEHEPELFLKTHKFIGIKEFIWYKIFKEFEIDHSIASCTGLFDVTGRMWYTGALSAAGITEQQLSSPVATSYQRITVEPHDGLGFLEAGIPFIIGASDGCLANLGSRAVRPGAAVMTIGTSGAVRIASTYPLPNEQAMTFSYILDEETFICGGPINNGGIALQWWLKTAVEQELKSSDYDELFHQIETVPAGSEGLIFLPYLTGERAPIWDSESCGAFFGVKLIHRKAHFSRAVLEGICYAMKDVFDAVAESAPSIDTVYINGGFTRSAVWTQLLADLTGKRLVLLETADASAIGAAFLTMKAVGELDKYPDAKHLNSKTIEPNPVRTALYSRNFSIFKKLYSSLKETMHEIS